VPCPRTQQANLTGPGNQTQVYRLRGERSNHTPDRLFNVSKLTSLILNLYPIQIHLENVYPILIQKIS